MQNFAIKTSLLLAVFGVSFGVGLLAVKMFFFAGKVFLS